MRRSFLGVLVAISVGAPSWSQGSIHEMCLKAADYKGCVEVQSGGAPVSAISPIKALVEAMKLLPSRISNSSRRDLYTNIQPFNDALSRASGSDRSSDYEREVYSGAQKVSRLINEMAETWSDQISLRIKWEGYLKPACENALDHVNTFNYIAGSRLVSYTEWTQKVLWQKSLKCSDPTVDMMRAISTLVAEVTEDPNAKKARIEKIKRDRELAEMEPWLRHLEENPNLKKWAEANPKAAEKAKKDFLEKLAAKNQTGALDYEGDSSPSQRNAPAYPAPQGGCNKYGVCR